MKNRTKIARTLRALSTLAILLLFSSIGRAQVSVALSPVARQQFLSATGVPLAAGCVSTFNAGTTTPAATYVDSGGVIQNTNPIILDAGGFATIYLANQSYKIQVNAAPATGACSSVNLGAQQWVQDNVSAYQILSISNLFLLPVTSDPGGTAGEIGYRSDIPCFRGFTTLWDCFTMNNLAQTLNSKTLVAPIIQNAIGSTLISPSIIGFTIGGVTVATGNPTNFSNFTNGAAGTTLNQLAKLVVLGAGSVAVNTAITDTGGVVGIVVGGAGTTGINVIQSSGQVLCIFDGATTAEDYVQISSTVAGNCHDTGAATYPTSGGQVIGRALVTAAAGTSLLDLFPHEIRASSAGVTPGCTNFTPVTVTNNNTNQPLQSCVLPANSLVQGSLLEINIIGVETTGSAMQFNIGTNVGGGTGCTTGTPAATGLFTNRPWNVIVKFFVLTAGAAGTANMSCEFFDPTDSGGVQGPIGTVGNPTFAINTTISNTIQISEIMTVLNATNSVTGQGLKAVVF
jgi:hypothetical protein